MVVVVVNSGNIGDSYGVYEDVRCSTLCGYGSQCALRSGDGGVRCRSGVGASGGWCLDKVVRAVLLCSASDLLPRTTSNGAHCYVMLKRGQRVRRGRLTGNKLLATLCLLAARVQLTTMVM